MQAFCLSPYPDKKAKDKEGIILRPIITTCDLISKNLTLCISKHLVFFFSPCTRANRLYKLDCLWKYQYACVHRNVCAFSELFVSLSKVVSVCAWLLQVYMCLFVCMSACAVQAFMQDFGLLNYDPNLLCVLSVIVNSPDSLCFSPQYKHWWKQRAHTEGCASASRVPLSWLSVFKQTGGPSLIYCYS